MINVLLADDHHLVRQGLRALLATQPDLHIVDEAADGREALEKAEKLRPQVLVLDLVMPGLDGLEVTRQVNQRWPEVHVIIVSMHASEEYVLKALRNGAQGYVLKDSNVEELAEGIRAVAMGRRFLCSRISDRAIDAYIRQTDVAAMDPYDTLTARERDVFQLVAEGYTNNEIAEKLFISVRTVETHRASVMRKLNLRTQAHLVAYAIRRGMIPES